MNLSATIAKMRAAGMSSEAILLALECLVVEQTPERSGAARRQAAYRERRDISPQEWSKIRSFILERDHWKCHYCGKEANSVDHKTPLAKGGKSNEDNLVAACRRCNSLKKDRTHEEWSQCQ